VLRPADEISDTIECGAVILSMRSIEVGSWHPRGANSASPWLDIIRSASASLRS
jgi:hypothetical protein